MRFLFIILSFLCFLNAKSFYLNVEKDNGFSTISINMDKDIYLYADSIKVLLNNDDITSHLELKQPKVYNDYQVYFDRLELNFPDFLFTKQSQVDIFYQGCNVDGLCYPPYKARFGVVDGKITIDYENKLASQDKSDNLDDEGYFRGGFFISIFSFLMYGILLSLTPCVLPMVPILSSIIMAKSSSRLLSSFIYVFGMSIAYSIAGVLAALFGQNLNAFFQSSVSLILFSLLFVVLSFSSFGFFELQMPKSIQEKLNSKSSSFVGFFGVFFMGVLSALIVGPCVAAPLAGALLYIANTNDVLLGGISLFMLSFGMGLPLIAIGFGFSFIKTGDFMVYVNRFFGFVLLGMANYFLSRLIDDELYVYLSYSILCLIFSFSFSPFGAKKGLMAKLFVILAFVSFGCFSVLGYKAYEHYFSDTSSSLGLQFVNIDNQKDFDKAIKQGKVMVYFTASWCANCKELKSTTFKDIVVINALNDYKKIQIDISKNDDFSNNIIKQYSIFGPPAMLFFNDGELISKKIGYKDSKELLEGL